VSTQVSVWLAPQSCRPDSVTTPDASPPIAADTNGRRCGAIDAGDHVAAPKIAVAPEAG
jgi:hypothetical protein